MVIDPPLVGAADVPVDPVVVDDALLPADEHAASPVPAAPASATAPAAAAPRPRKVLRSIPGPDIGSSWSAPS
jgi:hypothetical protein